MPRDHCGGGTISKIVGRQLFSDVSSTRPGRCAPGSVFVDPRWIICNPSKLRGQKTNQYDPGTPPQHAAGISPLGSFATADLGTVNLSNGSLNFKIPLGTVGGRGFSIPITLNYSSKLWSASRDTDQDLGGTTYTVAFADFEMGDNSTPFHQRIGAGWSIGGAPWLSSTNVNIDRITSGPWVGCPSYKLAKLTLNLPDRGEVEFRDDATDGAPLPNNCSTGTTASRGVRWHATDGSGTIFINDVNGGVQNWPVPNLSGVVITADGTRYRFGAGGGAESITDRHGNRISIQGTTYTDQLGRVTTIQRNVNDPETGAPLAALVTLPAYNGQVQYIKIKDGLMNQHYRSDLNVALPVVTGNYDPKSLYANWPSPGTVLFTLSYKLYQQQIDNREVLTEVILPNDHLLRFKYNQFGEVAEVELPTGGKVRYDYSAANSLPAGNSPVWERTGDLHTTVMVDRAVRERRTSQVDSKSHRRWSASQSSMGICTLGMKKAGWITCHLARAKTKGHRLRYCISDSSNLAGEDFCSRAASEAVLDSRARSEPQTAGGKSWRTRTTIFSRTVHRSNRRSASCPEATPQSPRSLDEVIE